MSQFELAQLNIAVINEPLDSPAMADFVANLDRINAIAEASPGFIWRLQTDEGNATALRPFDELTLVNMSVWRDVESLHAYVYRTDHAGFIRRRKEWFKRLTDAYMVLWWIPQGFRPTIEEAGRRLERLRRDGPGPEAFTFRLVFPPLGGSVLQ